MFGALRERDLAQVAASCVSRRFDRGEFLCHQGQPGDWIYVIGSGLVKVVSASCEGDEFILSVCGPGTALSEAAVFDARARCASVVAVRPTVAYQLHRSTIRTLMGSYPPVREEALTALAGLVRRLTEQISELAFLSLENRVACVLLRLVEGHARSWSAGARVLDVGLTQTEIGAMVGASRPAVNRALHQLATQGGIEVSGRLIAITNPAALRLSTVPSKG